MKQSIAVIVSPRERFEQAVMSLESLYETADQPVRVIYVDGGTPEPIATKLRALVAAHGDAYVRREKYLSPNQARNLATSLLSKDTQYVVFADNDVLFMPGWLSALVKCAEETGAGLVSPTILIGPEGRAPDLKIHHAGGKLHIEPRANGPVFFSRTHGHEHERYLGAKHSLFRHRTDCSEFHVVLVRKAVVDQITPFDENIVGFSDEVDMALLARKRGWTIWFEPEAVIAYATGKKITWNDLPYFCLRWGQSRCINAERYFYSKWGFIADFDRQRRFLRDHRRHAFPFKRLQRRIGWRATVTMTTIICEAIAFLFAHRMTPVDPRRLRTEDEDFVLTPALRSVYAQQQSVASEPALQHSQAAAS